MKKLLLLSFVVIATSAVSTEAQNISKVPLKDGGKVSVSSVISPQKDYEMQKVFVNDDIFNGVLVGKPMSKSPVKSLLIEPKAQTTPLPYFRQPEGSFFYGLSDYGYTYNSVRLVTHINKTLGYYNASPSTTSTFEWTAFDSEDKPFKSTSKHLLFPTEMNTSFFMPKLKETFNGKDSTFTLGQMFAKKANQAYVETFAITEDDPKGGKFGLTNANADLGLANYQFEAGKYCYGTGTGMQDALLAVFDKPLGSLYFEGVKVFAGTFSAPASTPFTMRVITYEVVSGKGIVPKDTVATSTITAADVVKPAYYTFTFNKFVALDEDGFESDLPYVEVNEPFMLELSGFNVPGVTLSVLSEKTTDADPFGSAYFYGYDENNVREIFSWTSLKNTMWFTLVDAVVGYIEPEIEDIQALPAGGDHEFKLYPLFLKYWLDEALPSWITLTSDDTKLETEGYATLKANVAPLPVGETGRQGFIKLGTWGAHTVIPVTQGQALSSDLSRAESVKAYFVGEDLVAEHTVSMTRVAIYAANGVMVASYPLDSSGKTRVSTSGLPKGVYVLQFIGGNDVKCKVVK